MLFLIYLALFCWFVVRSPFLKRTGIPARWLVFLFLLKVGTSCLYGYIYSRQPQFAARSDTWRFFYESLDELSAMDKDPASFFRGLFHDPYHSSLHRIFSTRDSYWNDLKNTVMVKMVTVFNLLSFRNYYINTILFSFICFFGPAALYRVFQERFPDRERILLAACFFVPSFLFWGSGLHKEGLIMVALGLFLFHAGKMRNGGPFAKGVVACGLTFLAIFILRINVLIALIPAATAWWWSERKGDGRIIFPIVHLLFIVLFFGLPFLFPKLDLPMSMHIRQQEFIELGGRTAFPVRVLEPHFMGFVHNLPEALTIAFLRPFPGEGGPFYIPFTIEMGILLILLSCLILFPDRGAIRKPLLLFSFSFALTLLLTIGYIVPNLGAVVRYRSIGMSFLFLFAMLGTDWTRVRRTFQPNTH